MSVSRLIDELLEQPIAFNRVLDVFKCTDELPFKDSAAEFRRSLLIETKMQVHKVLRLNIHLPAMSAEQTAIVVGWVFTGLKKRSLLELHDAGQEIIEAIVIETIRGYLDGHREKVMRVLLSCNKEAASCGGRKHENVFNKCVDDSLGTALYARIEPYILGVLQES